MKCQCYYLYGDWCHCPKYKIQEICHHYMSDDEAIKYCTFYKKVIE